MKPDVLINYYLQKHWYAHVQRLCEQLLEQKGSNPRLLFWRAVAIVLEKSVSSGIRELENLKTSARDVHLGCLHALIYAHLQCHDIDHDQVAQFELELVMAEDDASTASLLLCATFFWHVKNQTKARQVLDHVLSQRNNDKLRDRALILRGWVELPLDLKDTRSASGRDTAIQFFDQVTERQDAELVLGVAKYFETERAYPRALEALDELHVQFPWFPHSQSEKALVLLKLTRYDECLDSTERALSENPRDLDALRIKILLLLSRDGRAQEAAEYVDRLRETLEAVERGNFDLFCAISRCTARVSDRDSHVLQGSLRMLDHAMELEPKNGACRAERGYQRALLGEFGDAIESYKEALKLDESNELALHGMIYCQIKLGQLQDASQQMEFLAVIHESIGASASFTFLQALLSREKEKDRTTHVHFLEQTIAIHMHNVQEMLALPNVSTHESMSLLNPLLLVEIATEFCREEWTSTDVSMDAVKKGTSLLENLVSQCPGFLSAQFELATVYFDSQRLEDAYNVCDVILHKAPGHARAHLLQARVNIEREHFRAASSCLDQALSYDFAIRQSMSFYIIKAQVLEQAGDVREAQRVLEMAMKMVLASDDSSRRIETMTRRSKQQVGMDKSHDGRIISLVDKASVFIHMAQVLFQLNERAAATTTAREALERFRGTSQEVRVLVANSDLAMKRGDYEAAIAMLNTVPVASRAFAKAQMVKADIYLHYRKDKTQYARCYEELAASNPCHATHVSLAEAYLRIQRLDQAIESFQRAKALNPQDPTIAGRIGRVFISKHDYLQAVDYYETALKLAPENLVLRKELAELYTKLRHYDQALRVVQQQTRRDESETLTALEQTVELELVLASIQRGLGSDEMAVQALLKAYSIQKVLFDRLKKEKPDELSKQRRALATTCFQIATIYASGTGTTTEREQVIKYCTMALRSDETHEPSLLALARAYQQAGDLDQCQIRCATLLRLNPAHEEATFLLADLLLQKEDYEAAVYEFQQLLSTRPDNFAALSQFLVMLSRAGKLHPTTSTMAASTDQSSVARAYLHRAERSPNVRVANAPGLRFCQGLYARLRNDVVAAIDAFNLARRDPEWGERALIQMIEIYLNPNNENLWDVVNDPSHESKTKEEAEHLRIATALLDELPLARNERGAKIRVLEAYAVLAMRTKSMVEKAIQLFLDILETVDRDHVPALLGLASGYMLMKQQPKARNQLKRIAKMKYDPSLATEFERSYLLLADLYITRGKFDLAQELCKRALSHNKSSGKAWELLGLVMEKEQSYIDAAECYQEAWTCEGEASAAIGFKLAFNYLKAKKLVFAVDVCHNVLDQYPEYPKIRKEILEKAYAGFRP